jgi:ribonuclease R
MFTIDDTHTRDMDDAIEVAFHPGGWTVQVAISDVARVVKPGGPDDLAARQRGATRYYATGNSPMLGRNLADWTLSLVPERPRAVLVAEMQLDPQGQLLKTSLRTDRITSSHKLRYDDIPKLLESDHPLKQELTGARNLAMLLLNRRRAAGAMVVYDLNNGWVTTEEGSLKQLESKEDTIGYIIIQELMILANTAVATYAIENDIPVLFRNHEAKSAVDRQALMGQITQAMTTPIIDLGTLQHRTHLLLNRAYYRPVVLGHFGLNVPAYLHFTSPIRRYADLVNHQQLRAFLKKQPRSYTQEGLEVVATELNTMAEKAREESSDFFKGRAEAKARRQIDARLLDGLIPKEFERALKVELRSGQGPSDAMNEAWIRRLDQNTVPPICLTLMLMHESGPDGWEALREATVETLEERTEDAVTVLAQAMNLGWEPATFDVHQSGEPHAPSFRANAAVVIPGEASRTFYAHIHCKTGGTAKTVKQRAAVELLRCIVSRVEEWPEVTEMVVEPKTSPAVAPQTPPSSSKKVVVDLNKNPVSMLMELSQNEKVAPPEFGYSQTGPSHKPTFNCVARYKHFCVEVTAASKQEAKTLAAKALVKKLI